MTATRSTRHFDNHFGYWNTARYAERGPSRTADATCSESLAPNGAGQLNPQYCLMGRELDLCRSANCHAGGALISRRVRTPIHLSRPGA